MKKRSFFVLVAIITIAALFTVGCPVEEGEIEVDQVSLNKGRMLLVVDGEEALEVTVSPEDSSQEVIWSSSDVSIATVDEEGKVTAVAPGMAVITVKSAIDESKKATVNVIVGNYIVNGSGLETLLAGDDLEDGEAIILTGPPANKVTINKNVTLILEDIELTFGDALGMTAFEIDADVIIEMYDTTLSVNMPEKEVGGRQEVFLVNPGKALTIENGVYAMVSGKNVNNLSALVNNDAGTVTINGGSFTHEAPASWGDSLIPTFVDNNSNLGPAQLTINEGTFVFPRNMFRNFANFHQAKMTINGGTFSGGGKLWNQKPYSGESHPGGIGIIEINGGTFNNVEVDNEFPADKVTVADDVDVVVNNPSP